MMEFLYNPIYWLILAGILFIIHKLYWGQFKDKNRMKTLEGKWKYLMNPNKYFVFHSDGTFETNDKKDEYGTVDGTFSGSYTVTSALLFYKDFKYKLNLKYFSDKHSFYIEIWGDTFTLFRIYPDRRMSKKLAEYRKAY